MNVYHIDPSMAKSIWQSKNGAIVEVGSVWVTYSDGTRAEYNLDIFLEDFVSLAEQRQRK